MRVGIVSDTHDQLDRTRRAVELLQAAGAEALIHCGDLTSPAVVAACSVLPFYFVFGNNDADSVQDLQRAATASGATCLGWSGVVTLGTKRFGIVHGHLTTDLKGVLSAAPDYLLSGHSHRADDHWQDAVRRINPGALHRAWVFTVALLEVDSGHLQLITIPR